MRNQSVRMTTAAWAFIDRSIGKLLHFLKFISACVTKILVNRHEPPPFIVLLICFLQQIIAICIHGQKLIGVSYAGQYFSGNGLNQTFLRLPDARLSKKVHVEFLEPDNMNQFMGKDETN